MAKLWVGYCWSIIVTVGLLTGSASCSKAGTSEVTVINGTSKKIEQCSIRVGDAASKFDNLEPGKKVSTSFVIKTESDYKVTVNFSDGSKSEKKLGYVTPHFNFNDTIVIHDDDIVLSSGKVK